MTITSEDRTAVEELISLHGHIVDEGAWDRLHELFDRTVVVDLTGFGGGELRGMEAIRNAALALGERNPVAHHVTNLVLRTEGEHLVALSKGLGVRTDGSVGSVTYKDRLVRTSDGWRIVHRSITPRTVPLR